MWSDWMNNKKQLHADGIVCVTLLILLLVMKRLELKHKQSEIDENTRIRPKFFCKIWLASVIMYIIFVFMKYIFQHMSGGPWWINFASGQVDFQLTSPDGPVKILEKNWWSMLVEWANYPLYSCTRIFIKHLAHYYQILLLIKATKAGPHQPSGLVELWTSEGEDQLVPSGLNQTPADRVLSSKISLVIIISLL